MDEARFQEIYEKTARPLWSYLSRIAGSGSLADDFLQETFFRYLRAPISGDDAAVKSYLFKIATNLVYDHFRRLQREKRWQFVSAIAGGDAAKGETVYENFSGEIEMMQVFGSLNPQERALLWLAYVEGCEHREIADVLNLNRMSVRVLLFRARRKLAELLEGKTEVKSK